MLGRGFVWPGNVNLERGVWKRKREKREKVKVEGFSDRKSDR